MSTSTISEKRTVITSSSGSSGSAGFDLDEPSYKAQFGNRASNIMSRSSLPLRSSTGGTHITRTVEYGYGSNMGGGMGLGGYSNVSNSGVSTVKVNREKEKKDLQDLNERFASYIEKVRFLEAQNRKLGSELEELRSKWGKETSHIKQMYEAELAEARRLIDDLSKDKATLEIKTSNMQEQFGDMQRQLDEAKKYRQVDRDQINKLNQQLADSESEISMLRRTIESLETERGRDKATITRLQQDVDKLRIDINNETLAHLDAENRRQTLEEEMEFMKKVHEQELKELASLAYRDTTAENREYWKSELGQAIRDIQQVYDAKVDQLRGDMEGFYNLKIQEYRTGATKQNMEVTHIREENKKLSKQMMDFRGKMADLEARNAQLEKQYQEALRQIETNEADYMMETTQLKEEIIKLRAEMEGILTELQTLMDAKLSLELEIAAYRKLLEGEENRVDWRSRSSLIMYRDAFRPMPTGRSEPEITKAKEPEKSIEAKTEKIVSQREQREASPDTDAASSITMSDNDASVKGDDEGDFEFEDQSNVENDVDKDQSNVDKDVDTGVVEIKKVVEIENTVAGKDIESVDSNKSPAIEHVVKVKEEVKKIETHTVADETDSTPNGIDNAVENVTEEKDSSQTERGGNESPRQEDKSSEPAGSPDQAPTKEAVKSPVIEHSVNAGEEIQKSEPRAMIDESDNLNEDVSGAELVVEENVTSEIKKDNSAPQKIELVSTEINKSEQTNSPRESPVKEELESPAVNPVAKTEEGVQKIETHDSIIKPDGKPSEDVTSTETVAEKNEIKQEEDDKSSPEPLSTEITNSKPTPSPDPSPVKEQIEASSATSVEATIKKDSESTVETDSKSIDVDKMSLETASNVETKPITINNKEGINASKSPEMPVEVSTTAIEVKQDDSKLEEQSPSVAKKVEENSIPLSTTSKELDKQEITSEESKEEKNTTLIEDVGSKTSDSTETTRQSENINEKDVLNGNIKSNADKEIVPSTSEVEIKVESKSMDAEINEKVTDADNKDTGLQKEIEKSDLVTKTVESKVVSLNEYMENVKEDKPSYQETDSAKDTGKMLTDTATEDNKTKHEADNENITRSPSPKINQTGGDTKADESNSKSESESDNSISQSKSTQDIVEKGDLKTVKTEQSDIQLHSEVKNVEKQETNTSVVSKEAVSETTEISSATKTVSNIVSLSEYTEIKKESTKSETVSEQIAITETSDIKRLPIEKTEDKILESVVQSKIIETSPQESARIEMSPTKELPESNDKAEMSPIDSEMSKMKITLSEESKISESLPESKSPEQIEDDKTPEEETGNAIGNDAKQSDPLVEVTEKSVEISKIEESQKSSNIADVQPAESISNSVTDVENSSVNNVELEGLKQSDKSVSENADTLNEDKFILKESDIMSQSFIAENGQLINGDVKDGKSSSVKTTLGSTTVNEDTHPPKSNTDETPKQTKDKTEDNQGKDRSDEPTKPDAVLEDKIQHILQNGQESLEQTTISSSSSTQNDSQVSMKMMRGEVSAKTTYQRTSTGPIAISEVCPEGKFITLENTSSGPNKKDVNLDGWSLVRVVDNDKDYCYNFRNFTLKAGRKVKIMARGSASEAGLNDLVFREQNTWGVGKQVTTTLVNDKKDEKASHIQNTNYN